MRVNGYKWSRPFSVGSEGMMSIVLESDSGGRNMIIRVVIRTGSGNSRYEVIFRPNSLSSPYRCNSVPTQFYLKYLNLNHEILTH